MSGNQRRLSEVMSGALGVYWAQVDGKDVSPDHVPGYLRLTPQNLIQVETLLGDYVGPSEDIFDRKAPKVTSVVGRTAKNSIYLLGLTGQRSRVTLGGPGLSFRTYTFKCAALDVPIDELKSDRVRMVSVQFANLLNWAGMSTLEQKWITDAEGRNLRAEYILDAKGQELKLKSGSFSITLQPHWRVARPEGDVALSTALDVKCEVVRPVALESIAEVILRIQNLLSISRQGAVVAREGGIRVHLGSGDDRFAMWHRDLMVAANSTSEPAKDDDRLFFKLEDIGGVSGLARWIKLCGEHPRLVAPVVNHWRYGAKSAAAELLECAIAMEYFVKWTKKNSNVSWVEGSNFAVSIAKKLGRSFSDWSGDAEEWGLLFWGTYNAVKHNLQERDPREVAVMALSGRLVLTAFVLSRASGRVAIVKRFLNDHRFSSFAEVVREYVEGSNLKNQSRRQRRKSKVN